MGEAQLQESNQENNFVQQLKHPDGGGTAVGLPFLMLTPGRILRNYPSSRQHLRCVSTIPAHEKSSSNVVVFQRASALWNPCFKPAKGKPSLYVGELNPC